MQWLTGQTLSQAGSSLQGVGPPFPKEVIPYLGLSTISMETGAEQEGIEKSFLQKKAPHLPREPTLQ